MRRLILVFLYVLTCHIVFAQDAKIDSLLSTLNIAKEDTNTVNALIDISYYLIQQSEYTPAIEYTKKALAMSEKISYKYGKAIALNDIGLIYKNQGNFAEALKLYLASAKIKEERNDKQGLAKSYGNIGNIFMNMGNYSDAEKYHLMALDLWIEIKHKIGTANSYVNIGGVFHLQKKYAEALNYYYKAVEISKAIDYKMGLAHAYSNIGEILEHKGDYDQAIKNHLSSVEICKEISNAEGIAISYIHLGSINIVLKRNTEARKYLDEAIIISKEISSKKLLKDVYSYKAALDSSEGNFHKAFENYKIFTAYKDSLLNQESNKQIAQMKTLYETEKKDNEIVVLNKDKEIQEKEIGRQKVVRNGFMGGFIIVLLFAGVFFIQRNRISKEKQRSEDLLLNILPAEVAEELKQKGSADAKLIDEVTVIFTDFKGFTSLSEKLSPQELVKDLNECFSAFDHIMGKYGIEKIKTIGDSYMAAGGLPSPNNTHAVDVIKAALEMRDFVAQGKARKLISGEPYFEIRIGIHTGPVVAGIVGVKKFAYDIWGDTVNIASRMESSGEVGKVNISETTYDLVKDQFNCEYRGEIEAKGKGKVKMFFAELK